jgi:hypothetical protein
VLHRAGDRELAPDVALLLAEELGLDLFEARSRGCRQRLSQTHQGEHDRLALGAGLEPRQAIHVALWVARDRIEGARVRSLGGREIENDLADERQVVGFEREPDAAPHVVFFEQTLSHHRVEDRHAAVGLRAALKPERTRFLESGWITMHDDSRLQRIASQLGILDRRPHVTALEGFPVLIAGHHPQPVPAQPLGEQGVAMIGHEGFHHRRGALVQTRAQLPVGDVTGQGIVLELRGQAGQTLDVALLESFARGHEGGVLVHGEKWSAEGERTQQ